MIVVAFNELHGGNSQRGSLVEVAAVWEGIFRGGGGPFVAACGSPAHRRSFCCVGVFENIVAGNIGTNRERSVYVRK